MIVDWLSKQGIFIPTTIHCTSEDLTMLSIMHMFSKHSVLEHVTSDHGLQNLFLLSWKSPWHKAPLHTAGYHLEGDGQTKWTNQTLEQYLWIFCDYQQDNWYTLLPLVKFTYNNTSSATTGISLFFANKSYHLNLTVHPKRDLASSHTKDPVVNLDELHQELDTAISEAQLWYQGTADTKRSPACISPSENN